MSEREAARGSAITALREKVSAEIGEASAALELAVAANEEAIATHAIAEAELNEIETAFRPLRHNLQRRGKHLAPALQRASDAAVKRESGALTAKASAREALRKCRQLAADLQAAAEQLESIGS
jgi:hypothetical protein